MPLEAGVESGDTILAVAVLSIMLTAPIEAIGIEKAAIKWLEKATGWHQNSTFPGIASSPSPFPGECGKTSYTLYILYGSIKCLYIKHYKFMKKIYPETVKHLLSRLFGDRYKSLKLRIILLDGFIALVPLIIVVTISYFWFQQILKDDFKRQLQWEMQHSKQSIEIFVEERLAILRFLASSYTYEQLLEKGALASIFSKLKMQVCLKIVVKSIIRVSSLGLIELLKHSRHSPVELFP